MKGTVSVTGSSSPTVWSKGLVLTSLLLAGLLFVGDGRAQMPRGNQPIVADVIVQGNRNVPTARIMREIKTRVGQTFSRDTLYADVDRLHATGLFRHVTPHDRPTNDGRILIYFSVTEYPNRVAEVIYKNAHHLRDNKLEELTNIRKGQPLNPIANRNACFAIQDHLRKEGRYFANVTLEEGDDAGDKRVIFNITEGPIVRVRSIRFEGHKELATSARLRTQIDTSTAILMTIGGKFTPQLLARDVLKLQGYFKANGYLDARVTRELVFTDDYEFVDVIFHIHEGQRYRVKDVTVRGPRHLDESQVSSVVQLAKGEFYDENTVSKDLTYIKDLYGWRGYLVNARRELYFTEPGTVRVQYQVAERPPAKVGQVIIVGNTVTKDRVIRRLINLYPGQTLQFPQIRQAERELARAGIFKIDPQNGVRPTIEVLPSDSEFKDVVVRVQETQTGSFVLGAGVNSDAGLVGSIVLNEKNFDLFRFPTSFQDFWDGRAFRGAGQELRVEAVPGTELQRYTISFREPFLFDRPFSLSTSGFYFDRVFDEYTERRVGGRLTLGHNFTPALGASIGLRIENIDVRSVAFGAPADYTSVAGNNFLIAPRIGASYDTRDSYLRPTAGGRFEASYEQAFGEFTFPIFTIEGSRYFTTFQRPDGSGKHVLALRSQVGFATGAPVYERFFAGGFRSIRGFEFRGMGPRSANGFALGGDFMFLNSIEYQVPVRANDQLYLVAFVDSGTVESNIEINGYRVTAGFGVRLIVPMLGPVPIALDFGFPINEAPQDRDQVFAFWIGLFR